MRPETIARTYRVPSHILERVHNICERDGVTLSDIVRRYAQHVVRTHGQFLRLAPRTKSAQLNVRMPFDLAHTFSLVCKQTGSGTSTAMLDLMKNIADADRVPEELMQESEEDTREYIRRERARLDALESKLGKRK